MHWWWSFCIANTYLASGCVSKCWENSGLVSACVTEASCLCDDVYFRTVGFKAPIMKYPGANSQIGFPTMPLLSVSNSPIWFSPSRGHIQMFDVRLKRSDVTYFDASSRTLVFALCIREIEQLFVVFIYGRDSLSSSSIFWYSGNGPQPFAAVIILIMGLSHYKTLMVYFLDCRVRK